ncbi:MAG TPA: TIGR03435 family protein [Vicinamibacterales bacterium]|nr:TIGR03435 family protein [Vicinamibacterales bacterium]
MKLLLTVFVTLVVTADASPQVAQDKVSNASPLRFDVVSVKETPSGSTVPRPLTITRPDGLTVRSQTVIGMIQWAYGLPERDIQGGTGWPRSRRFDVDARTSMGGATLTQLRSMMRNLLVDRFALDVVYDRRVGQIYAVMLNRQDGRLGPALRASTSSCQRPPSEGILSPVENPHVVEGRYCGVAVASSGGLVSLVLGARATTADIARGLSPYLDRPVVDRAGLTSEFDFLLAVIPPGRDVSAGGALTGAEIFTAIREQLGLKLQPDDGEVETLVIRGVSPPTEN